MEGKERSNAERRLNEKAIQLAQDENPTLMELWCHYLDSKSLDLRGVTTDTNRWTKHLAPIFGQKTPDQLSSMDVELYRRKLAKTHSNGTVRNVIELLRRIINHGIRLKLCAPLDWTIQLPKVDQSSERIEVLTKDQIRSLYEVWEEYPDRLIVNQHMLIMWTGMRPIESLSLRWSDINLEDGSLLKRKTKSGKNVHLKMNETVRKIFREQKVLLDHSPNPMKESQYVFPTAQGGIRRTDSYRRHFAKIRDLAGIPREYRPNYCLRDTLASQMLSDGVTLDEVGYQLGHEPGSSATKRYAKLIPEAQQRIVDRSEEILSKILRKSSIKVFFRDLNFLDKMDFHYICGLMI